MTKPLKSLIPDDPTGLRRTQYKYKHPKAEAYIIATFIRYYENDDDQEGKSIAEWSLILDNDRGNDYTPITEDQITPTPEFYKMVENWEEKGHYDVICR